MRWHHTVCIQTPCRTPSPKAPVRSCCTCPSLCLTTVVPTTSSRLTLIRRVQSTQRCSIIEHRALPEGRICQDLTSAHACDMVIFKRVRETEPSSPAAYDPRSFTGCTCPTRVTSCTTQAGTHAPPASATPRPAASCSSCRGWCREECTVRGY